jgi:hypothetical protein
MTQQLTEIAVGAATGLAAAMAADLRNFVTARKADRSTTFDWALALSQWMLGALTGATTAAGIAAVS